MRLEPIDLVGDSGRFGARALPSAPAGRNAEVGRHTGCEFTGRCETHNTFHGNRDKRKDAEIG
jgi:hypothetical protein